MSKVLGLALALSFSVACGGSPCRSAQIAGSVLLPGIGAALFAVECEAEPEPEPVAVEPEPAAVTPPDMASNLPDLAQTPVALSQNGGDVYWGFGPAVTDVNVLNVLGNPGNNGQAQRFQITSPATWPIGGAPVVSWSWATNDADAVKLELSTASGSFSWVGTFGRPRNLKLGDGTDRPFREHPIPTEVWAQAADRAGTSPLTVRLTIARGGQGYGAIVQTWTVAR